MTADTVRRGPLLDGPAQEITLADLVTSGVRRQPAMCVKGARCAVASHRETPANGGLVCRVPILFLQTLPPSLGRLSSTLTRLSLTSVQLKGVRPAAMQPCSRDLGTYMRRRPALEAVEAEAWYKPSEPVPPLCRACRPPGPA